MVENVAKGHRITAAPPYQARSVRGPHSAPGHILATNTVFSDYTPTALVSNIHPHTDMLA